MKNNYIVLQVRINSKRLPKKLILPLKGITIFEHILKRLSLTNLPEGIIVATTKNTLPFISKIAKDYNAFILMGAEEDVLSRFVKAVDAYKLDNVIRTTGDNPLVCIDYIDKALLLHKRENADLTTFIDLPYGTGVEVIKGKILKDIEKITSDPFEREHITQYICRHESKYNIVKGNVEHKLKRPEIRLTVDTKDDYVKMCNIYEKLYKDEPIRLMDVIKYLDSLENN